MKKIMRIFATIIISAALLITPISALADENHGATVTTETDVVLYAEADTNNEGEVAGEDTYEPEDTENRDGSEKSEITNEENVANEEKSDVANEENGFEKIYDAAMTHVSEILSLAAFIGSLICAIIYKSGLMPLMEKGLGGIKNAAQKIKEATDRAECDNKASLGYINDKMNELEIAISEMQETVKTATQAMDSAVDMKAHQARIDGLLAGELDMLYDIFMSSALPEYEKARVGERVAKLKEGLNSDEHEK